MKYERFRWSFAQKGASLKKSIFVFDPERLVQGHGQSQQTSAYKFSHQGPYAINVKILVG